MSTQAVAAFLVLVLVTSTAAVPTDPVARPPSVALDTAASTSLSDTHAEASSVDPGDRLAATTVPREIDSCRVIDQPGTYVLTQDVVSDPATTPAGFACLLVTVSDVTIDGDGHSLRSSGRTDVGISAGPSPGPTAVTNLELAGWAEAIESADVVGRVQPTVGRVELVNVVATDNDVGFRSDGGAVHVADSEFSGNRLGLAMSENVVTIERVVASENARSGLSASQLSGSVTDSEFSHNGADGIQLAISGSVDLRNVVASHNGGSGVTLAETDVTLVDSELTGNGEAGLRTNGVSGSRVSSNDIADNEVGVWLDSHLADTTLTRNRIENNADVGILVEQPIFGGSLYDNVLVNDENVRLAPLPPFASVPVLTWSVDPRPGLNVVEGAFVGGNYYSSPEGDGFSETCVDTDVDTLCDAPLELFPGNVDAHPLATPSVPADEPPTRVAPDDLRGVTFRVECGVLTGGQTVQFGYGVLGDLGIPPDAATEQWSNADVLDAVLDSALGPVVRPLGPTPDDLLWAANPDARVVRVFAGTPLGVRSCTGTLVD
jgi:hypothetical protein